MMNLENKRILISRTDSIGDVMLTLPMCAWIKEKYPSCSIVFLGKTYTKSIISLNEHVDEFQDWDTYQNSPKAEKIERFRALAIDVIVHVFPNKEIASLARKVKIPVRVGTSHRSYHLLTCNYRLNFSRRKSNLHEAQLNHELLRPFGLKQLPTIEALIETTNSFKLPETRLPEAIEAWLNTNTQITILHPKSQGSAKEWPINKYIQLAKKLSEQGRGVIFTGTEKEGELFRDAIPQDNRILDTTGKLSLDQLILLITRSQNLVACSTGPLHIAATFGIRAIGLYSPKRPIHPGRWKAIGNNVRILVNDPTCKPCEDQKDCDCILDIPVSKVLNEIE